MGFSALRAVYRDDEAVRLAVRESLAVGIATSFYGVSFGALGVASGLSFAQTWVLSLVMFSGGSQFALVGVVAVGSVAAGPAAMSGAALLGVRNTIYAIRMSSVIGGSWWRRLAAAWITIDESTAVSLAQRGVRAQRWGFWATGIIVFLGWNATTVLGALIGDLLGDTRSYGLDAAAAAAFLALLWPRLKNLEAMAVGVTAAIVAILTIPVLPAGVPVLVAALVAVVVGLVGWRKRGSAR